MENVKRQSLRYRFGDKNRSYKFTASEDWDRFGNIEDWKKKIAINNSPYTVTHIDSVVDLIESVEHVVDKDIEGDFVECGVFMGGSSMIMASTLKYLGYKRKIWMYDTYDGVPLPEDYETTIEGYNLKEWYLDRYYTQEGSNWCYTSLVDVKQNFQSVGYKGLVNFIKGKVEDTIPKKMPNKISILRIDVDLAKPTRHILEHLYPLVSDGGHIILDDYGHFPAVKETVDDYFKDTNKYLKRVTYTVRHIVK